VQVRGGKAAGDRDEEQPEVSAAQLYKPPPRECALLLLHLIDVKAKETGKEILRLRLAEVSLKRLWGRRRISPELLDEVGEWLSGAGVNLFFAGSMYGVVKTRVVESWPRVTSKRISADLRAVAQGTFNFKNLEPLLAVADGNGKEE
jgi:hypothetical protein